MSILQIIEANVYFILLTLAYRVLFATSGFLKLNRVLLLLFPVIAIALPFSQFSTISSTGVGLTSSDLQWLESVTLLAAENESNWNPIHLVWITGAFLGALVLTRRLLALHSSTKNLPSDLIEGVQVKRLNRNAPSFSFMRTIYLNAQDAVDAHMVLNHEMVHAKQLHTLDVLFSQLVAVVAWFNPAVYLWNKLIRENHEYLADQGIDKSTVAPTTFAQKLIEYALSSPSIGNAFGSNNLLTKRLEMFSRNKPQTIHAMKYLLFIPLIAIFSVLSACSKTTGSEEQETPAAEIAEAKTENITNAEFPGGFSEVATFLQENLKYPTVAKEAGTEGTVIVAFKVSASGAVEDVSIANSVSPEMDAEALRVVQLMPDWNPATKDGKPVKTEFKLPIVFKLQ